MIPAALFVPASLPEKYNGHYEVAHQGVVLRVRGSTWEHIGGVWHEHIPARKFDTSGQPAVDGAGNPVFDYLKPYTTIEHANPKSGKVVEAVQNGQPGWFLVPEKYIADFDAAIAAELARQTEAQASADAKASELAATKPARAKKPTKE